MHVCIEYRFTSVTALSPCHELPHIYIYINEYSQATVSMFTSIQVNIFTLVILQVNIIIIIHSLSNPNRIPSPLSKYVFNLSLHFDGRFGHKSV